MGKAAIRGDVFFDTLSTVVKKNYAYDQEKSSAEINKILKLKVIANAIAKGFFNWKLDYLIFTEYLFYPSDKFIYLYLYIKYNFMCNCDCTPCKEIDCSACVCEPCDCSCDC